MKFRVAGSESKFAFALAVFICIVGASRAGAQSVGLFFNDGAEPGYNLFAPNRGSGAYLVDNDGQLINSWIDPDGYSPGASIYLTERGTLMKSCFVDEKYQVGGAGGGRGGMIREYAWDSGSDGKAIVIWQYRYNTANAVQHHDFQVLPNGNVLITAWEKDATLGNNWEHLVEVKPDYSNWDSSPNPAHGVGGKIVWEWHQLDYLVPAGSDPADHPDLWDPALSPPRINAVHYDAERKHLLLSAGSEIWIINKDNNFSQYIRRAFTAYFRYLSPFMRYFTPWIDVDDFLRSRYGITDGIMYRWGNPATYLGSGDQLSNGQHGVSWIKRNSDEGYRLGNSDGVGNILFFNNQFPGGSAVQEFRPPYQYGTQTYAQPPSGVPFAPANVLFSYTPVPGSPFLSNAQRLPGGRTLICSGTSGTFQEVTSDGTVVWKYVSPVANVSPVGPKAKEYNDVVLGKYDWVPVIGFQTNGVFRVRRYAPQYPGFSGKDLSPLGELIGDPAP